MAAQEAEEKAKEAEKAAAEAKAAVEAKVVLERYACAVFMPSMG